MQAAMANLLREPKSITIVVGASEPIILLGLERERLWLSAAVACQQLPQNAGFPPSRAGSSSLPTQPRLIAAIADPTNPPVMRRSNSVTSAGVKFDRSARTWAAQAITPPHRPPALASTERREALK